MKHAREKDRSKLPIETSPRIFEFSWPNGSTPWILPSIYPKICKNLLPGGGPCRGFDRSNSVSQISPRRHRERERERVGGDTGGVEFRDRLRKTGRRELDGIDSKNSVVKKKKGRWKIAAVKNNEDVFESGEIRITSLTRSPRKSL